MKSNNARPHSPRVAQSATHDDTLAGTANRSRFLVGEESLRAKLTSAMGGWSTASSAYRPGSVSSRPPSSAAAAGARTGDAAIHTPRPSLSSKPDPTPPIPSRPMSAKIARPTSATRAAPKWAMPQLIDDDTAILYSYGASTLPEPRRGSSGACDQTPSSPAPLPAAGNTHNCRDAHTLNVSRPQSATAAPPVAYELSHRPSSQRSELAAVCEATRTSFHVLSPPVQLSDRQTLFEYIQTCFDHNTAHTTSLATACEEAMGTLRAAGASGPGGRALPTPNGVEASVVAMLLVKLTYLIPTGVGTTIRGLVATLLSTTFIPHPTLGQISHLVEAPVKQSSDVDLSPLVQHATFAEELHNARQARETAERQRANIGTTLARINKSVAAICIRSDATLKRLCFRAWKRHAQNREVSEGNWLALRRISTERETKRSYLLRWWAAVCNEREVRLGINAEAATEMLREQLRTKEILLTRSEAENAKLRRSKAALDEQVVRLEGLLEDERAETLRARMRFREVEGELQEFKKHARAALRLLNRESATLCPSASVAEEVAEGLGGIGGAKPRGMRPSALQHAIGRSSTFKGALGALRQDHRGTTVAAVSPTSSEPPHVAAERGLRATAAHVAPYYVSPSLGSLSHSRYIANVPAFVLFWVNQALAEARSHLAALQSRVHPVAAAYYHNRKTSTLYPQVGWFGGGEAVEDSSLVSGLPVGAHLGGSGIPDAASQEGAADIYALLDDLSSDDEDSSTATESDSDASSSTAAEEVNSAPQKEDSAASMSRPSIAGVTTSPRFVSWLGDGEGQDSALSPSRADSGVVPRMNLRGGSHATIIAGGRLAGSRSSSLGGHSFTPPSPAKAPVTQALKALRRWRAFLLEVVPSTVASIADLAGGQVYLVLLWRILGHSLGISDFYVPRLPANVSTLRKKKRGSSLSTNGGTTTASSPRRSVSSVDLLGSGGDGNGASSIPFEAKPDQCARVLRMATYLGVDGGLEVPDLLSSSADTLTRHFLFCVRLMGVAVGGEPLQAEPSSTPLGCCPMSSTSLLAAMVMVSASSTKRGAKRRTSEAFTATVQPNSEATTKPLEVAQVLGHSRSFSQFSSSRVPEMASHQQRPALYTLYSRSEVSDERLLRQTVSSEHLRSALEGIGSRLDTVATWKSLNRLVQNYAHKLVMNTSTEVTGFDARDVLEHPTGLQFSAEAPAVGRDGTSVRDGAANSSSSQFKMSDLWVAGTPPPARDALTLGRPKNAGGLQRAGGSGPLPLLNVAAQQPTPLLSPMYLQPSSLSAHMAPKVAPLRVSITPAFILHLLRGTAIMPAADSALVFSASSLSAGSAPSATAHSDQEMMAAAGYFSNEINDVHTTHRHLLASASLYYATCSSTETPIPDATLDAGAWVRMINDLGIQYRRPAGATSGKQEAKDAFLTALQERATTVFRWLCAAYGEDNITVEGHTTPAVLAGARVRGAQAEGGIRVPLSSPTAYMSSCALPVGILYLFFAVMQSLRLVWAASAGGRGDNKDPTSKVSLPFRCVEDMASMYRAFFETHIVARINTSHAGPLFNIANSRPVLAVLKRHRRNLRSIFVEFGGGNKAAAAANARLCLDSFVDPLAKELKIVDIPAAHQLFHTVRLGGGVASPASVGIDFDQFLTAVVLLSARVDTNPVGPRSVAVEHFITTKLFPPYRTRLELKPW